MDMRGQSEADDCFSCVLCRSNKDQSTALDLKMGFFTLEKLFTCSLTVF